MGRGRRPEDDSVMAAGNLELRRDIPACVKAALVIQTGGHT
jgi:hypothetical protein